MADYFAALSKVLPVIWLLLLGAGLNRAQFVKPTTIQEIKKLIVNLTLPAVLFLAFARAEIQIDFLFIVATIFALCVLALFLGIRIQPLTGIQSHQFPTLLTGFEAGMMGYAIFSAVYGTENIYKFAVVDLGQVTFVFFILVPFLERLSKGPRPFTDTLANFLRTPVILAILAGLLANPLSLVSWLESYPITNSLVVTLGMVGGLTTPLVALVIGYEMHLQRNNLGKPLLTTGVRLLYWVPLALAINTYLIGRFLGLDPIFQAAVLTMLLLPPPFVIPLFMKDAAENDRTYVVNTLSIATLITLFAFALVGVIYPP